MNEVFLIDKPAGRTSYNVIDEFKGLLKTKKIGHSGTLDKFATGLLILCTGWTTKLTRYFLDSDKRYIGKIKLGVVTDTCDIDGEVTQKNNISGLTRDSVLAIKKECMGNIRQIPPVYPALKVNGKTRHKRKISALTITILLNTSIILT